jgi:tetratricopeptide (TPR) repeat protein
LLREGNGQAAVAELEEAVRLNPENARAYGVLAHAYNRRRFAEPSSAVVRPPGPSPSVDAARRGVELDPACGECHGTLALYLFYHDWKIAEAEWHFREALRLAPDADEIAPDYAMLLAATGREQEALQQVDRGLRRQPHRLSWLEIRTSILYFTRRFAEAIATTDVALSVDARHLPAWDWRSRALFQLGRGEEAIQALIQGRFADQAIALDRAVAEGGVDGALRRLLELTDDPRSRVEHSWRRASWRALLHDDAGALDEIDTACRARRLNAINFGVDPVYDRLRQQPRFIRAIEQIGVAPYLVEQSAIDMSWR